MSSTNIDYSTILGTETGVEVLAAIKTQVQTIQTEMQERVDIEYIAFPVVADGVDLAVADAVRTFRMPYAFTLIGLPRIAMGDTAPTGAAVTVDVNETGVSIFSTKLTIDATEKVSTTAAIPCVVSDTALADFAEISIDIDTIGSTLAGAGLTLFLYGRKT